MPNYTKKIQVSIPPRQNKYIWYNVTFSDYLAFLASSFSSYQCPIRPRMHKATIDPTLTPKIVTDAHRSNPRANAITPRYRLMQKAITAR